MFKHCMAIGFLCVSVGLLASEQRVIGETRWVEGGPAVWCYEIIHYHAGDPQRTFTDLKEAYFYVSKLPAETVARDMLVINQVSDNGYDRRPSSFTFAWGVDRLKDLVTEKFGPEALIEKPVSSSWFAKARPLSVGEEEFTHYHDGELQATFVDLAAAVSYFRRIESSAGDVDRRSDAINHRTYDWRGGGSFSFNLWRENLEVLLEARKKAARA
ncbi:MAG: hypothetical protein QG604_638 [Candidatus Dependentiae bacterium]|nr:hypothetical protein [Candidatus Dependentiae bacterium]